MSSADAIITASLVNMRNNLADVARVRSSTKLNSEYNQLVDRWNNLVKDFNLLQDKYQKKTITCQTSFNQTEALMAYINAGRIAMGLPSITVKEILDLTDKDPFLNHFRNEIDRIGLVSKIGFISQTEAYWNHIRDTVFAAFKDSIKPEGDFYSFSNDSVANQFLDGIYGQVSGYALFRNMRRTNQALVQLNRKANDQCFKLSCEIERLNEENAELREQLNAQ